MYEINHQGDVFIVYKGESQCNFDRQCCVINQYNYYHWYTVLIALCNGDQYICIKGIIYTAVLNCMWREVVERKQVPTGREECDYHTEMSLVDMEKEILSLKNAVGKQQGMIESMSNQIKKLFGMFAKIKHAVT